MSVNYLKNMRLIILTSLCLASVPLSACQPASDTASITDSNDDSSATQRSTPANKASPSTANSATPVTANTSVNPDANTVNSQAITILALGDSLTEGLGVPAADSYPAQLEAALKQAGYQNIKVINSGLSGETSTGLVNRLDWVLKTKPDITILTVGANDAMRGIEVAIIEQNIRTAIDELQANGSTVILAGMQIYDNLGNDYVQQFSDMYPRIARDTGVAFIPFFLNGVAADPKLNQEDAIHPTAEGYSRIVQDNIMPVLEPTLVQVIQNQQQAATNPSSSSTTAATTDAKSQP